MKNWISEKKFFVTGNFLRIALKSNSSDIQPKQNSDPDFDFSLPIWWETEKMKKKKKKKETKSDYEFFTFDSKSLDNELEHGLIPVFCCIFEWRL